MKRLALATFALVALAASAGAQVIPPGTNPVPVGAAYNSVAPTCVTGSACWLQVDVNGNLKTTATFSPSGTQDVNVKQVQGVTPSGTNPLWTFPATGTSGTTNVASAALAANQVILASAGSLFGFNVSADSTLSAAAWWIIIYNATSAPADGAVTPARCYAMPASTTSFSAAFPIGLPFTTGITIGVSTTGCFTKTASTHAFIAGDYK